MPTLDHLPAAAAEHYVDALLAEYGMLRTFDDVRITLDPAELPAAERINKALRDFAAKADDFLRRAEATSLPAARLAELRRAAVAARATSAMSPALMQERWRRVEDGRTTLHSAQEMRGELWL